MSRENGIAKHRLGLARSALIQISKASPPKKSDGDVDYRMLCAHLKNIARLTIKRMEEIK